MVFDVYMYYVLKVTLLNKLYHFIGNIIVRNSCYLIRLVYELHGRQHTYVHTCTNSCAHKRITEQCSASIRRAGDIPPNGVLSH